MALTWFLLTCLTNIYLPSPVSMADTSVKLALDSKKRHDVVDEAFLEQKDVLLDMLESKLKEVRDKKKKKSDRSDNNLEGTKCEGMPSNVDVKLKANGLSAIGEADLALKFGSSGKGTLNLDANGISNVGKVRLDLGVGDGGIYIPGLNNLFAGRSFFNNCTNQKQVKQNDFVGSKNDANGLSDFHRSGNDSVKNTGIKIEFDDKQNATSQATADNSTTLVDNNGAVNKMTAASELVTATVDNSTSAAAESTTAKT